MSERSLWEQFKAPLKGWGNHDLLANDKDWAAASTSDPKAFLVIGWKELRDAFETFERKAVNAKNKNRIWGSRSILFATIGACLLAVSGQLEPTSAYENIPAWLGIVGAILTVLGLLCGVVHFIFHTCGDGWLKNRIAAERLRHFYFQFLIIHFPLAVSVIEQGDSGESFTKWTETRAEALNEALTRIKIGVTNDWDVMEADRYLERMWVIPTNLTDEEIIEQAVTALQSSEIAWNHLMVRLLNQRANVQKQYARYVSSNHFNSRKSWAAHIRGLGIASTTLTVALTGAGALLKFLGLGDASNYALIGAGVAAAIGLGTKLVQNGMKFDVDANRAKEYLRDIEAELSIIDDPRQDPSERVNALIRVERHAYWETREFYRQHKDDSFF